MKIKKTGAITLMNFSSFAAGVVVAFSGCDSGNVSFLLSDLVSTNNIGYFPNN